MPNLANSAELTYVQGRSFTFDIQVAQDLRAELDIVERVHAMGEDELDAILTGYIVEDKKVKVAAYLIDELYRRQEECRHAE